MDIVIEQMLVCCVFREQRFCNSLRALAMANSLSAMPQNKNIELLYISARYVIVLCVIEEYLGM